MLKQVYEHNETFKQHAHEVKVVHRENATTDWGGYIVRAMLNVIFRTAFLCLLRVDEILRVDWADIVFEPWDGPGGVRVVLRLPYRKTAQHGGEVAFLFAINGFFSHKRSFLQV